jgi:putative transferase (TIGR04331 family)
MVSTGLMLREFFRMPKTSRYLITSADERTWKFDRPVVFLGEWCRLHERKHVWQGMDAIVVEPYGLGKIEKDNDDSQARRLEEKLLSELCRVLNEHHAVEHDERFWRILLGYWLRVYVNGMLNRVKTLEKCLQGYELSGTTVYANEYYSLASLGSHSSIWAFNDSRWNIELNRRVLMLLGITTLPTEFIQNFKSERFDFKTLEKAPNLKAKIINGARQKIAKLATYFARDSDAFIINSYLPKITQLKLQIALGQCPQLWASPKLVMSETADRSTREKLARKVEKKSDDKLLEILSEMVFDLLPVCYLEGFGSLHNLAQQQPWPKNPKFIFTSNNFATDEVFKLWAASKVELGARYIVGQHGCNYGTGRYWQPTVEEDTADQFLTWGWTDGLPQHTASFIFKTAGKKVKSFNSKGGLLLIQDMYYPRIDTWDRSADYLDYFETQAEFTRRLSKDQIANLTIRLHATYKYNNPYEKERWKKINPALNLNSGSDDIEKLISESRLVVHGYDSTGILESLSLNSPCLAFWNNNFDHLRESAIPYYQLLVDAGIVHLSPESAAHKVNEVWSDIQGWWSQSEVQEARIVFCERYAKPSHNPVQDLKKILTANDL